MEDESISSESVRPESSATNVSDTKLSDELIHKQQELENENIKLKSNLSDSRQKIERLTTPALGVYQDDPVKRNMFKEKVGEEIFNRVQSNIETLNLTKEQADKYADILMEQQQGEYAQNQQQGGYANNQQQGTQENNPDNRVNDLRIDVITAFRTMGNQEMANRALSMNPNELLTCANTLSASLHYSQQQQQGGYANNQGGYDNNTENTPNNQVAQQPLNTNAPQVAPAGTNDVVYDHKTLNSSQYQALQKSFREELGFADGKLPDNYKPLQQELVRRLYKNTDDE